MSQKKLNSTTEPESSGENKAPAVAKNAFQKSGSEEVFEVIDTKEAIVYRVDLPGCPESDLVHWIDRNMIHFFADEPAKPEYEHSGRKYGGTMLLNTKTYDVKEAKVKLACGVIWITVPKIPGTNASTDTVMKMLYSMTKEDFLG